MVLRCGEEWEGLPVGKFKVIFIYKAKLLGSHFGPERTLCSPAQPWEGWDVHSSLPPPLSLHPGLLQGSCHSWKSQEASLGGEMTCSTAPNLCSAVRPPLPVPATLHCWHTLCHGSWAAGGGRAGCGMHRHDTATHLGMLHVMLQPYCITSEARFCFRKQWL